METRGNCLGQLLCASVPELDGSDESKATLRKEREMSRSRVMIIPRMVLVAVRTHLVVDLRESLGPLLGHEMRVAGMELFPCINKFA